MRRAGRIQSTIVGATMAALAFGMGGLVLASSAVATTTMTATTYVNMRSGPGTSYAVVTVLSPSQAVQASGTVTNGWYQVVTASGQSGWVYRDYLVASTTATTPPATTAPTASGTVTTTAAVNVRSGPGTSYEIVAVAPAGKVLSTTGKVSGTWTEVIWDGSARWIATSYLGSGSAASTPKPVGQVKTTANLYLRVAGNATATYTGTLPAASIVDTTGNTTADYTEIIYSGELRWIATRYTTPVTAASPSTPGAPVAVGTVYVNVGTLNVRATSAADGAIVGTVSRGTALQVTGVTAGDRTQVIYLGAARWVYTAYVSTTPPTTVDTTGLTTSGIDQLNANGKAVVNHVIATYPKIRTIYGWRASSDYSSDHPNGRAVDIMIPNWSDAAMSEYGWTIARDFLANASKYKVTYIIYRQQIWNASYPERGWRAMEDRGSVTANHYDHVHVSVSA